jgi:hypothetical protein
MSPVTNEIRNESRAHSAAWLATAVGAGIGIAALAYSRRPRSRWDRARDQTSHLIDSAREEIKPWMGVAAGTAAAGSALAIYLRNRKESGWQRASRRASEIATHLGTQATNPWANLAATAAIGLVSVAYANKVRRRTIRGIDERTADRINALTEKGAEVLRRFRNISEEAAKVYPRVRRAMA